MLKPSLYCILPLSLIMRSSNEFCWSFISFVQWWTGNEIHLWLRTRLQACLHLMQISTIAGCSYNFKMGVCIHTSSWSILLYLLAYLKIQFLFGICQPLSGKFIAQCTTITLNHTRSRNLKSTLSGKGFWIDAELHIFNYSGLESCLPKAWYQEEGKKKQVTREWFKTRFRESALLSLASSYKREDGSTKRKVSTLSVFVSESTINR
jgi:hypothetical protein